MTYNEVLEQLDSLIEHCLGWYEWHKDEEDNVWERDIIALEVAKTAVIALAEQSGGRR